MIRDAIQAMLDAHGDGWTVGQHVIVMSLERVDADGRLITCPWIWTPRDQAEWMTDGLLAAAHDLRGATVDD